MSAAPSPPSLPTATAVAGAFERLHPGIQRQLWRMGWTHLRQLQVDAIHAILGSEDAVLLAAATAAGKTEAAFLPILSRLAHDPGHGVQALYVGPLRALINDQFARLEVLCEKIEVPVHHWHGDVGLPAKRRLIAHPAGVLLITPESLESLFVNRSAHLGALFGDLKFVVIDELHVFLGSDRGRQLQSLLARLQPFCTTPPRRIGLSATLSPDAATNDEGAGRAVRAFLSPQAPESVHWLTDDTQKPLGYRVHTYLDPAQPDPALLDAENEDVLSIERLIAADVARHFDGQTSLVFANTRGNVEAFADLCTPLMRNRVCVHHGSLAGDIREETESHLKASEKARAVTAFCSSTLELGIDLGDVEAVGQIGPPLTVTSMKQRLGRSGRGEDARRVMRVFLELEEPAPNDDLFKRLHLPLIQTIAATELMLEGWVEPPIVVACDLSTLAQQIVSVISQTGGIAPQALYETLCKNGAFSAIEPALFARVLRCLGHADRDIVEQAPTGELILGLRGERMRHSRDFYAVFSTPEEHAIYHQGRLLGHMPIQWAPPVGEYLTFAGRRWLVTDVDQPRRQIHVVPAAGKRKPMFVGEDAETHPRLRQKMREVLAGDTAYTYLDATAGRLLAEARRQAAEAQLCTKPFLALSDMRSAVMLWTGDRLDATSRLLLMAAGATVDTDRSSRGVAIIVRNSEEKLREACAVAAALEVDPLVLAHLLPEKKRRKYDELFTSDLLEESLARDWLDVAGARQLLALASPLSDHHALPTSSAATPLSLWERGRG